MTQAPKKRNYLAECSWRNARYIDFVKSYKLTNEEALVGIFIIKFFVDNAKDGKLYDFTKLYVSRKIMKIMINNCYLMGDNKVREIHLKTKYITELLVINNFLIADNKKITPKTRLKPKKGTKRISIVVRSFYTDLFTAEYISKAKITEPNKIRKLLIARIILTVANNPKNSVYITETGIVFNKYIYGDYLDPKKMSFKELRFNEYCFDIIRFGMKAKCWHTKELKAEINNENIIKGVKSQSGIQTAILTGEDKHNNFYMEIRDATKAKTLNTNNTLFGLEII